MTLAQMQTEILGYLTDPTGTFTKSAEVTLSLNLAQDELAALLHPQALREVAQELIDTATGTTTANVETFALPGDFIQAVALQLDGYTARGPVNPEDRAAVDGSNTWTTPVVSDPAFYTKGSNLHHFAGTAGLASAMSYSLDYVKQPTRLQSDSNVTDFGVEWDKVIIDLATNIRAKKMGAALQGGEQIAASHRQEAMQIIEARNAKYAEK